MQASHAYDPGSTPGMRIFSMRSEIQPDGRSCSMKNHINDLIDSPQAMRTSWQKTLIVNLSPYTQ